MLDELVPSVLPRLKKKLKAYGAYIVTIHTRTGGGGITFIQFYSSTQTHTYTNIKHKIFEELVPSVLPLINKHIRLGHVGILDNSVGLSISDLNKKHRNGQKQ